MDNSIDLLPLIANLTKVGNDQEARVDRLLGLLREILEMEPCPFCWANSEQKHADTCKLAKELANDNA